MTSERRESAQGSEDWAENGRRLLRRLLRPDVGPL